MARLAADTDAAGCRTLWLNRPEKRNALDEGLLGDIAEAAHAAGQDPAISLVVLRAHGPTFCAGADLNDWADVTPDEAQRLSALGSAAFRALAELPVPVVAAIDGAALGGGLELVLACDIRLGTTACRLGFPEPRLGNSPAWGGMARLVEAVGIAAARDLLLTGDVIAGPEAFRIGLLQRLCPPEGLEESLAALRTSILACDPGTLRYIKALLGAPAGSIAAIEAAVAGFTATRPESRRRKQQFLDSRRRP